MVRVARLAFAVVVASFAAGPVWAFNVTCGSTVQSGQTGTVTGVVDCTCGGSSSYCVKVVEGGVLDGTGSLRCPANATTCTEAAIKVDSGSHADGALIDASPSSRITIEGNGIAWRTAADNGKNFKLGVSVTGSGIAATMRDLTVYLPGWYGIDVRQGASIVTRRVTVDGGSGLNVPDEGIHVGDATATLNPNTEVFNVSGEGIYLLATNGAVSATVDDVEVNGFGTAGAGFAGVKVEVQEFGTSATLTGSKLTVTGSGANARCIKATDTKAVHVGAQVAIDNSALVNGSGTPISGLNCTKYWLEAESKSTIDFTASVAGVCCCKITPTSALGDGTKVTLNLSSGNDVACTNCSGCC